MLNGYTRIRAKKVLPELGTLPRISFWRGMKSQPAAVPVWNSATEEEVTMNATAEHTPPGDTRAGPKFFVNVEGVEHEWDRATITPEEIARLGGWDASVGVIEIDADNNERTLTPGEEVELKPGHGFAKKIKFRRG
jgi:hypothetical protein